MITAHDDNLVIGNGPDIPWHSPDDFAFFKKKTLGKNIVMGRKTFESIGRPLPKRQNIVLTNDPEWHYNDDVKVYTSHEQLMEDYKDQDLMICGGSYIYELFMPYATVIHATHVHGEYEGDIYFPEYRDKFKLVYYAEQTCRSGLKLTFNAYGRK